jgi:spermidine/putrescine transport system substrate-binding protein
MKATFRLSVSVLLLVLAVLPGALRGSGPAAAGAGKLIVFDWSPYDEKEYYEDFEGKHHGVAVVRAKADDAAIFSAVQNGEHADIIHPYTTWLKRWVDKGWVEEIDTNKLTNWPKVPDALKAIGQFDAKGEPCWHENGTPDGAGGPAHQPTDSQTCKQYFIAWDVGFSSILYRTDLVNKAKGKPTLIDSWEALFDKDYKNHIYMLDDGPSAVEVYSYTHPVEKQDYDQEKITTKQFADKVKEAWVEQKRIIRGYWGGDQEDKLVNAMVDGRVWVAYAWPSAYNAVKEALKEADKVKYAEPKEGRISWVGVYGILKGTTTKPLALEFLDEKLSPGTAQHVVELGYGVANEDIWKPNSNSTLTDLKLDDPSVLQRTNFPPEYSAEQTEAWAGMWTDVHSTR